MPGDPQAKFTAGMTQIPLVVSADAQIIIDRVKRTYANGVLGCYELQTSWRPANQYGRPWTDQRLWAAVSEASASGQIKLEIGATGERFRHVDSKEVGHAR